MRIKIRELQRQAATLQDQTVTLKGWIRTVRDQKGCAFVEVNDGSTLSNMQFVVDISFSG